MNFSIILAEDEIAGKRWQRFLERRGHFVMLYKNGMALRKDIYEGLKYDIAFVDLSLPEVDGDVIAQLCQEPCAKAQGVLGFLSTFKNAFFLCELKQAEFIKSIFDVSKIYDF